MSFVLQSQETSGSAASSRLALSWESREESLEVVLIVSPASDLSVVVTISVDSLLDLAWDRAGDCHVVDLAAEIVMLGEQARVRDGVAIEIEFFSGCVPAVCSPVWVIVRVAF